MKLSNKTYDTLKWIALTALPAIEVLWLALGKIWNFPYVVEIGATIAAVDVFLGTLLGVNNIQYNRIEPIDIEGMPYLEDEEIELTEVEDDE